MKNMTSTSWLNEWQDPKYIEKKKHAFDVIDDYLMSCNYRPNLILDIGCGLAFESEYFQKKYNSDVYLLDDDFDENTENQNRDVFFGPASSMKFYSNLDDLFLSYKKRNLRYKFVYAKNPIIDKAIKFDLIYSNRSYGFHYPVETYIDMIKKHSHTNTIVILDMWKKTFKEQIKKCNLINILEDGEQHYKVHIEI